MYNVDDAIAKIDGYVISIAGGGPFVGEIKLIKIDEVRSTAAYASIVTSNGVPGSGDEDEDEEPAAAAEPVAVGEAGEPPADENGAKLQSKGSASRRRRGRRGGRRRSGARGGSSGSQ